MLLFDLFSVKFVFCYFNSSKLVSTICLMVNLQVCVTQILNYKLLNCLATWCLLNASTVFLFKNVNSFRSTWTCEKIVHEVNLVQLNKYPHSLENITRMHFREWTTLLFFYLTLRQVTQQLTWLIKIIFEHRIHIWLITSDVAHE